MLYPLPRCDRTSLNICLYNLNRFRVSGVGRVSPLPKGGEMHTSLRNVVLVVVCAVAMTSPIMAQRTTATFAGIVTDPSSAVLPGATVQLISEGTNALTEKVTGET